ncbi:hypothetical protein Syun_027887 [Stephania yunnanensis]|uniref:Uncharacterized protein n=1 Tax=Stephania yunnanensis TaxID=152371 RepID=A0AAP0EGC6_9MAGN
MIFFSLLHICFFALSFPSTFPSPLPSPPSPATPPVLLLDIFACRNNSCLYRVSYGDGSYTVGDCISETLTFNDAASVDNIAHGYGHNIQGLFVGAAGFYKGVTTSQLDELAAKTAAAMIAATTRITLRLIVVVSNLHKNTHVLLCGVGGGRGRGRGDSVAEAEVGGGGEGVIVDLGTAVTSLETAVYEAVRDEFRGCEGLP